MDKLLLPPTSVGYSASEGDRTVLSSIMDGGRSILRRGLKNPSIVNCQWKCNPSQYRYLRAFYHTHKGYQFECDLILDTSSLVTRRVIFAPDAFELNSKIGLEFNVSSVLEVK